MKNTSYHLLRLLRPRQWIKNFAIFAAITFSGNLFEWSILQKAILAFACFCLVASSTYIINDLFDIKKDSLHPFKRFRPLVRGDVSKTLAVAAVVVLMSVGFGLALKVSIPFFLLLLIYLFLQFTYSLLLKSLAVLDILAIASGYILRVYAGEFATGMHISVWLLLTTVSLALFLAIGKRRSELTLVSNVKNANIGDIRKSLSHYSERLLDIYASIFATSTFVFYSLFTFLENPQGFKLGINILMPEYLPAFFLRKWLMITIIPVVYGFMRYLQDIYEKHEGESPEKVLVSDKPLLTAVAIWVLLVVVIIYFVSQ